MAVLLKLIKKSEMEKKNRALFNYTTFGYTQNGATVPLKVMDSSCPALQKGFRKAAGKCPKVIR
jgi:hypothetical protein